MLPRLALSPHISAVYLLSSPPLSSLPPPAFSSTSHMYLLTPDVKSISQSLLTSLMWLSSPRSPALNPDEVLQRTMSADFFIVQQNNLNLLLQFKDGLWRWM